MMAFKFPCSFLHVIVGILAVTSCILDIYALPSLLDRETEPPKSDENSEAVEATQQLLEEGEREIRIDPNYRDVILVVGNTGAGKSTITQFLAGDNEHLISYEAEDGRYLIRDAKNRKISEGGTLVSHSIFPDLVIDPRTNTAFYDCPGFSDTRNASVEIANAFFIKKVADHAERVKLLFVVNYSSLKSGETRTGFKTLIEQATNLIRNPAKFQPGIALIATKAENQWPDKRIVNGIAKFLGAAKKDLKSIIKDPETLSRAYDLLDAFLSKNDQGSYNRIGFFRQPEELGPLSEIEAVQEIKANLEEIVFNNTEFVPKLPGDFRVSVTDSAQLLVTNIGERYNSRLTHRIHVLATKIRDIFKSRIEDNIHRFELLPEIRSAVKTLQSVVNELTESSSKNEVRSNSYLTRQNCFEKIFDSIQLLRIEDEDEEVPEISAAMLKNLEILDFLETIRQSPLPIRLVEWTQPLKTTLEFLNREMFQFESNINLKIDVEVDQVAKDMVEYFWRNIRSKTTLDLHSYLQNCHRTVLELIENLSISPNLLNYLEKLSESSTFLNMTKISSSLNSKLISPILSNKVTIDFRKNGNHSDNPENILKQSPYRPQDWTSHLKTKVLKFLNVQNYETAVKINSLVQDFVQSLGFQLTDHFVKIENTTENLDALQLYDQLKTDTATIHDVMRKMKGSERLEDFSSHILFMISKLNLQTSPDSDIFQHWETIKSSGSGVDLLEPIDNKASPYKPFDWVRPLEDTLQVIQNKLIQLSKEMGENGKKEAEKAMKDTIKQMNDQFQARDNQRKMEEERREKEREEWLARENQIRADIAQHRIEREKEKRAAFEKIEEMHKMFLERMEALDRQYRADMERLIASMPPPKKCFLFIICF